RLSGLGKDHDLDIAVANLLSQDVHLLRNQFNNGFAEESEVYAAGETPTGITSADFDRDGDIDLAMTNLTTQTVSILLNRGGRTGSIRFTEPTLALDFGQVYVGTDSTQTLNIINPTNEDISLINIATTLPVFTTSATQAVIGPGENFALAVTFSPADTVVYEDSLSIQAVVLGVPSQVTVGLRGEGILAIISVIPDTLNFGNILPPQSLSLPIEIINGGNGALQASEFVFTDPAFSAPVNQLTVPPHSRQQVNITFTPALPIAYIDTLTVVNNDSLNPRPRVILLGGPNAFPPHITSADTVTAIEDIFFAYTATAGDSDGTQPLFTFSDLPRWLSPTSALPTNSSVQGTPREGDRDTSFVVIARDGSFSDTLAVFVRVIPVNDPPAFDPIADQTTTEVTLLTFDISASDPEDSTLTFSSLNLPPGATLTNTGRNSARFSWIPAFGSRGVHTIAFVVREVFEAVPLSDTTVVRIVVGAALPDLVAQSLGIDDTDIALGQTQLITGVARANVAPVTVPFRLTFLHDGAVAKDTVVAGLGLEAEVTFTYSPTFNRLGTHEIIFVVDMSDQVAETNEDNNSAILRLNVTTGALAVRPNPFTPNDDGFNDLAVFDFGELILQQPQLKILKFNGSQLATLTQPRNFSFEWNGRDDNGREQHPGIYLYILTDGDRRVASGYVVLAR
ncbi:MAG TPA: CARDB domain-containing protein, partial [bacterium]